MSFIEQFTNKPLYIKDNGASAKGQKDNSPKEDNKPPEKPYQFTKEEAQFVLYRTLEHLPRPTNIHDIDQLSEREQLLIDYDNYQNQLPVIKFDLVTVGLSALTHSLPILEQITNNEESLQSELSTSGFPPVTGKPATEYNLSDELVRRTLAAYPDEVLQLGISFFGGTTFGKSNEAQKLRAKYEDLLAGRKKRKKILEQQ